MWALGVKPSDLDVVYWSHSHNDLETIVSLATQYEMAKLYQGYESLRLVVSEALGGNSGSSSGDEDSGAVGTFEELARSFRSMGGLLG